MKRQRGVNGNMANTISPAKFEDSTSMVKMEKKKARREIDQKMGKIKEVKKKKARREIDQKVGKIEEVEKKEGGRDLGLVGAGVANNNLTGVDWEDDWPWLLGSVVDEQMSWGSVWSPVWDMDFMGDAFSALYNDVVWDDDIWNLKKEIPIPSQT